MATYKTPGVYVEEISTLPPSVAEVATAVPAFIGFTQNTGSQPAVSMVRRITSMLEYRQHFGGPPPVGYTATIKRDDPKAPIKPSDVTLSPPGAESKFILYYSLKAFFENGGGPCYVVSIGDYDLAKLKKENFIGASGSKQGLQAVALLDEPTLLLFPDAVNLSQDEYAEVCDAALHQCRNLRDRFTIMDVRGGSFTKEGSDDPPKQHAAAFRDTILSETEFLKYGAAYTPFLNTLTPYEYLDENIKVQDITPDNDTGSFTNEYEAKLPSGSTDKYLSVKYTGDRENPTVEVKSGAAGFDATSVPGKLIISIAASPQTADDAFVKSFNDLSKALKADFSLALIKPGPQIVLSPAQNPTALHQKFTGSLTSGSTNLLAVEYVGGGTSPGVEIRQAVGNELTALENIKFVRDDATGKLTVMVRNNSTTSADFLTAWGGDKHTRFGFTVIQQGSGGTVTPRTVSLSPVKEFYARLPAGNTSNLLEIKYTGDAASPSGVKVQQATAATTPTATAMTDSVFFAVDDAAGLLTITLKNATGLVDSAFMNIWNDPSKTTTQGSFTLTEVRDSTDIKIVAETKALDPLKRSVDILTLNLLNSAKPPGNTAFYSVIRQVLAKQRLTLPPSPAMAGIYARVDRVGGVWKTPANVSVIGISGPTHIITNSEQDDLNVDAISGKSINAIRSFTGKGTLVWGGRTLAGNDNEWRYISVRRLFNLIEESVQKSTAFAVFESNDSTTWLKVKAMIDSYLYSLWQQGALAGSTPEQAFFVNVGLGKTMTPQDILEGRMNIEIGLAAVRPAEFIILKFSHKLQEA